MRIQALTFRNYLCHAGQTFTGLDAANCVLVSGPNGSGKSALLDAIRLCLTGDLPRGIAYKKDVCQLLTTGESAGSIRLQMADGADYSVNLKTGAATPPPPLDEKKPGLYALAPGGYHSLGLPARRKIVMDMCGISITPTTVVERLAAKGHDAPMIDLIRASLPGGLDAASRKAKELASEARGAWQAITGEAYGSKKAEDWAASVPDLNTVALKSSDEYTADLAAARKKLVKASSALDILLADKRRHDEGADLRARADQLAMHDDTVAGLQAQLAASQERAEQLARAASEAAAASAAARAGGWRADCPCCGEALQSPSPGKLTKATDVAPTSSPGLASADAQAAELDVARIRQELGKAQHKADQSRAAKLALESLPAAPADDEIAAAKEAVRSTTADIGVLETMLAQAKAAETAKEQAVLDTQRAKSHHERYVAMAALQQAIEELPSEFTSEALNTVNAVLRDVSSTFPAPVTMMQDMALTYGGLPYQMLSESQQWRAELALALALASRTTGLVLADRFDIVQPSDRAQILQFLGQQQYAHVILGATLKQAPSLPDAMRVSTIWLG